MNREGKGLRRPKIAASNFISSKLLRDVCNHETNQQSAISEKTSIFIDSAVRILMLSVKFTVKQIPWHSTCQLLPRSILHVLSDQFKALLLTL